MVVEKEAKKAAKHADWEQLAEESQSESDDIGYLAIGKGTEIEQVFAFNDFSHVWNVQ